MIIQIFMAQLADNQQIALALTWHWEQGFHITSVVYPIYRTLLPFCCEMYLYVQLFALKLFSFAEENKTNLEVTVSMLT